MAKNGKRSGKRTPTPAKAGDTLDRIPTFQLPRDLYETERKEHVIAVRARLSELKSLRKKIADGLGIAVADEKEVSKVIAMYEGDEGILALWHNDEEEEEHTAEEVKRGGKDLRQREFPIDKIKSESTPETRASTEPIGVDHIDQLVAVTQPHAPSDLDWDAFRRSLVEMSGDERRALHEYAERRHQFEALPPAQAGDHPPPQMPGFLHALFCDLSPAYAQALGNREDVVYRTDIERAMAKAKNKGKGNGSEHEPAEPTRVTPTAKQMGALKAIAEGHSETVSASMYRKLVSLGLAGTNPVGGIIVTESGKKALEPVAEDHTDAQNAAVEETIAKVEGEIIEASPAGLPAEETWNLPTNDAPDIPEHYKLEPDGAPDVYSAEPLGVVREQMGEPWGDETLRVPTDEPVTPIKAE